MKLEGPGAFSSILVSDVDKTALNGICRLMAQLCRNTFGFRSVYLWVLLATMDRETIHCKWAFDLGLC